MARRFPSPSRQDGNSTKWESVRRNCLRAPMKLCTPASGLAGKRNRCQRRTVRPRKKPFKWGPHSRPSTLWSMSFALTAIRETRLQSPKTQGPVTPATRKCSVLIARKPGSPYCPGRSWPARFQNDVTFLSAPARKRVTHLPLLSQVRLDKSAGWKIPRLGFRYFFTAHLNYNSVYIRQIYYAGWREF